MAHPTSYWDSTWTESGRVWRHVVNAIGREIPSGEKVLALAHDLIREDVPEFSFLHHFPEVLRRDAEELKTEAALANIGMRLWEANDSTVTAWLESLRAKEFHEEKSPIDPARAKRWWFKDIRLPIDHLEPDLYRQLKIEPGDAAFLDNWARKFEGKEFWHRRAFYTRWRLEYFWDLPRLADLADKTWGSARGKRRWTEDDLEFVNKYYEEQEPFLVGPRGRDGIDPFSLRPRAAEGGVGIMLDGIGYCLFVINRTAIIDFANELINHNLFPAAKGSIRCLECGRFVQTSFYGRGQSYCSMQCKKRAAKRRYRAKARRLGKAVL